MLLLATEGFSLWFDGLGAGSSLETMIRADAPDVLIDGVARMEAESTLLAPEINSGLKSEEDDEGANVPGEEPTG